MAAASLKSWASSFARPKENLGGFLLDYGMWEVYTDLMHKIRQETVYYCREVHGKRLLLAKNSLFIFDERAPCSEAIRYTCVWLVEWPWFERAVVGLIAANSIVLAFPAAYDATGGSEGMRTAIAIVNMITMIVFTLEMVLKIIARGFIFSLAPDPCYMRDPLNWLDLFVVLSSWFELSGLGTDTDNQGFTLVRSLRILRPLRTIHLLPHLRLIVISLMDCIPLMGEWLLLIGFFFTILAIGGSSLFNTLYWQRCRLTLAPFLVNGTLQWPIDPSQPRFCGGRYECVNTPTGEPTYCGSPVTVDDGVLPGYDPMPEILGSVVTDFGISGFQTFPNAFMTVFHVSTMEGWTNTLQRFQDGHGTFVATLFFVGVVMFGGFLLMNIVVSILEDRFSQTVRTFTIVRRDLTTMGKPFPDDMMVMTFNELVETVMQEEKKRAEEERKLKTMGEMKGLGVKSICFSIISKPAFQNSMLIVILFNSAILSTDHYPPFDPDLQQILETLNIICSVIFSVEIMLKIVGMGIGFFGDNFNLFDLLLVIVSMGEIFFIGEATTSAMRTARLLRIFKMIGVTVPVRVLLRVLRKAVTPSRNFAGLMILIIYTLALLGLQFFFTRKNTPVFYNFDTISWSLLSVFMLFVGQDWYQCMVKMAEYKDTTQVLFFYLLCFLIGNLVLGKLFTGIFVSAFAQARGELLQDFRQRLYDIRFPEKTTSDETEAAASKPEVQNMDSEIKSPRWPEDSRAFAVHFVWASAAEGEPDMDSVPDAHIVLSADAVLVRKQVTTAYDMNFVRMMKVKKFASCRRAQNGEGVTFRPPTAGLDGNAILVTPKRPKKKKANSSLRHLRVSTAPSFGVARFFSEGVDHEATPVRPPRSGRATHFHAAPPPCLSPPVAPAEDLEDSAWNAQTEEGPWPWFADEEAWADDGRLWREDATAAGAAEDVEACPRPPAAKQLETSHLVCPPTVPPPQSAEVAQGLSSRTALDDCVLSSPLSPVSLRLRWPHLEPLELDSLAADACSGSGLRRRLPRPPQRLQQGRLPSFREMVQASKAQDLLGSDGPAHWSTHRGAFPKQLPGDDYDDASPLRSHPRGGTVEGGTRCTERDAEALDRPMAETMSEGVHGAGPPRHLVFDLEDRTTAGVRDTEAVTSPCVQRRPDGLHRAPVSAEVEATNTHSVVHILDDEPTTSSNPLSDKRNSEMAAEQSIMDVTAAMSGKFMPQREVRKGSKKTNNSNEQYMEAKMRHAKSAWYVIAQSPAFDPLILCLILVSSICLAFESPYTKYDGKLSILFQAVDAAAVFVFTGEMIVKMRAYGLMKPPSNLPDGAPNPYFKDAWNWIDCTCVVTSAIDWVTALAAGNSSLKIVRAMRVMRVLRPLKLIKSYEGVRTTVEGLLNSLETIGNLVVITMLFYLGFGILFVNMLKGQLWHCSLDPTGELFPEIDNRAHCLERGGDWVNRHSNFDNIGHSLLTLLHMSTGEGMLEVLRWVVDSRGVGLQPRTYARPILALPVCMFIALSNFFIMNLFIGVLVDHFLMAKAALHKQELFDYYDKVWLSLQKTVFLSPALVQRLRIGDPPVERYWGCRLIVSRVVESPIFDGISLFLILANTLLLCIRHATESKRFTDAAELASLLFVVGFNAEAVLKIFVYRRKYFRHKWNVLDFAVVVGSNLSVLAKFTLGKGSIVRALRGFRVGRVLRLARYAAFLNAMIDTLYKALAGLANVSMLIALVIFMYSCLGVGLFATTAHGTYLSDEYNFESFGNSMLLLLRVSTGEGWQNLMYDLAEEQPGCTPLIQSPEELQAQGPLGCGTPFAYPYFVSYQLIVKMVMINLIVGVLMDSFNQVQQAKLTKSYRQQMNIFVKLWKAEDPAFSGYLSFNTIVLLVLKIDAPLGFKGSKRKHVFHGMRFLRLYGKNVHIRDVMILLAQRAYLWLREEAEMDTEIVRFDHTTLVDWILTFPEVEFSDVYQEKCILIAHVIIASHVKRFITRKREQWERDDDAADKKREEDRRLAIQKKQRRVIKQIHTGGLVLLSKTGSLSKGVLGDSGAGVGDMQADAAAQSAGDTVWISAWESYRSEATLDEQSNVLVTQLAPPSAEVLLQLSPLPWPPPKS